MEFRISLTLPVFNYIKDRQVSFLLIFREAWAFKKTRERRVRVDDLSILSDHHHRKRQVVQQER